MKRLPVKWKWWRIDGPAIGVLLAGTLLFYLAGMRPLISRLEGRSAWEAGLAAQRGRAIKLGSALATIQARLAEVTQALAENPLHLEPITRINQHLAAVSQLATEIGLKIDEIQPGQLASGQHYCIIPIQLAGTGTYPQCVAFLHRLHGAFPETCVGPLELTSNAHDPFKPGTFRFELQWHAVPAPEMAMKPARGPAG